MRKTLIPAMLVLLAAAGLTACSPGGSGQGATTGSSQGSVSASAPASGTPSADAESTAPAPSPSAAAPTAGPGQGNAELAIMVKPSASGQAANYTLVCQKGIPAAESQHPTAAAACTALKDNAALLSPAPRPTDKVCTQQYGGPAEATVTGSVDGSAVEANFSLRDGCEIAQWKAAKDVLGSTGGAV
ncbi:SSI family serine proteinase inhibitor [Arthrobacter sp. UYEF3]|uniref:SSI family serine proteinase inhibitor n=1 Tax=Arthrobacter sp. UYEF3 TaxID=1756365 RepID=UPI00339A24C1